MNIGAFSQFSGKPKRIRKKVRSPQRLSQRLTRNLANLLFRLEIIADSFLGHSVPTLRWFKINIKTVVKIQ